MATSVKTKFAGLLRSLLRQMDGGEKTRPVAAAPLPPAPPAAPASISAAPQNNFSAAKEISADEDEIQLSLAAVIAALPMDLRARLVSVPVIGASIRLSRESVMTQLAFGAVKITFGELRHLAPGIFANTGGDHDNRPVNLPLQEILSRLNPELLARRHHHKIEVADEIAGPFSGRGAGIAFTTQPLKASETEPVSKPKMSAPLAFTPPSARQITPTPMNAPLPPRATAPVNGHLNHGREAMSFPPANGTNGKTHANGNGHSKPPLTLKITAAPVSVSATSTAKPEAAQPTIFAALSDLSQNWPDEMKEEISRQPFAGASVPLSGAIIEPGLKRGRVAMTWKQIRLLAQPGSDVSANDNLELELPLKVIAPLFLAAKKNQLPTQAKIRVTADIPDLFFGFPQPASAPVMPLPSTPTLPKNADTNFFAPGQKVGFPAEAAADQTSPATDFMSRQAHPKEVVAAAIAMKGVAGAVVALPDGLRVASEVSADLNADTLAAFLPQIFERVNQSTRELRMGALNNVSFTVGNVPWKIFRVNSVYFAAFGRAGEALPTAELVSLAAQIDRKKNQ